MDRRQFLAASGLAAATPVLSVAAAAAPAAPTARAARVNFTSDGLGLEPTEYAAILAELAASDGIVADNYSNGGAIATLEERFATLLGKEAAMFVPTGTLANHLAIRTLAGADRRVLVQAESHYYNDSGDGAQALSGLNLVPLAPGGATPTLAQVQAEVDRGAGGRVPNRVGVISIESPVRRKDHEFVDFGELERISGYARERGIRLHLDGARLFNLPLHTGKSVREHAALFDTVFVSLWKHFNAGYGAMLAGSHDFIEGLYHVRRMFGGSLPQAWAGVAVATHFVEGYADEYARAWRAADALIASLQADAHFTASKLERGTSRFLLDLEGANPDAFVARLAKAGVVMPHPRPGTATYPMQVNATLLRIGPDVLARLFKDAAAP
jgi:threonine aldolase